jgi:hypothetical protein
MPQRKSVHMVREQEIVSVPEPLTVAEQFYDRIESHPARESIIVVMAKLRSMRMDITHPVIQDQAIVAGEHAHARLGQKARPTVPWVEQIDARAELVYYMRLGELVKIGTSRNLKARREALNPQGIIALEFGGRELERERHSQFARSHVHGEWFNLDEQVGAHVTEVRADFQERTGLTTEAWLDSRLHV